MPSESHRPQSSLDRQLLKLRNITVKLRTLGLIIVIVTGSNILISLAYMASTLRGRMILQPLEELFPYPLTQLMLCGLCIFAAVVFEVLRHQASALFEEISDELHWRRRTDGDDAKTSPTRPPLEARVILRAYAKAAELPFFPGGYGPIACILANVGFVVVALFLPTMVHRY